MHLKNKRPVLVPREHEFEIERLSKAALMDMAWSFAVRCCGEEGNHELAMTEFRRERDGVLAARATR